MKTVLNKLVKVRAKDHAKCVAQSIFESWNKECYSNVKLIALAGKETCELGETKILSANKLVLAAASKKLAAMLADTEEDVTIIVPDHNFTTLKFFLHYIYLGEVLVTNFTPDLKSLMEEWDISYPKIIPVVIPSCVGVPKPSSTTKKITNQMKNKHFSAASTEIHSDISDVHCSGSKDENNFQLCFGIEDEMKQAGVSVDPPKIAVKTRNPRTKSTSATPKSSNYVFLATYIKNSKSKMPTKAETPTSMSKNIAESIAQVVSGYSEESLSASPTSGENKELQINSDDINGCKNGNKPKKTNLASKEIPDGQEDDEFVEIDTEEDLRDLGFAVNLLKNEKKRHQELSRVTQDLSGKVQRHRSYLKHFLGYESVVSQTSDQLASRIACDTCGKIVFRDYMPIHVKIHTTERPYLCEQCGQTFALPERLRNHLKNTHPDESQLKLHACPECDKTFKKAHYLQRHLTLHNGQKPYSCPYCDKSFRLPNVLLKHKRIHTGEKPYECETCHRRFSARTNYVVHLRTHRKKSRVLETTETESFVDPETQLLKCDVCGTCFHREYAFLVHKAAHKGEKPQLPCRHCTETFSSYKLLREHTRDQHADALYQCEQCPSMFVNKTALQSHLLIHTQGKQFSCDLCNKGFQTKVQLETHRRSIHSEIRPFPCRFCDKTFKSKLTQRQHERIHTGERPYQCPHCPKAFRQDVHLANHIRLHTGEKPFVCTYCNKAFAHKNNLMIHVKIHTGDKNQCGVCGKVFRTIVKLRLHESTHTPIPVIEEVGEEMTEETL